MEYEVLIEQFLKLFPQFKNQYVEHIELYDEFLGHVFFGDEVSPYIHDLLRKNDDPAQIEKFFCFFEWMAAETNLSCVQVLTTTILYNLGGHEELLQTAQNYMKTHTKRLSQEMENLYSGKFFEDV